MNRKSILKQLRMMVLLLPLMAVAASCASRQTGFSDNDDGQQLIVGDSIAIVQTQYGKVQGYVLRHVHTFLGIPYGASTAGENRFMPPQPPAAWDGVFPALYYGGVSPQPMEGRYSNPIGAFRDHWNYTDPSEDCLRLNVWTPQPDSKKRPVLVWMHGGGFATGNAIEQDGYNGANLTRYGDIVFVSVNHRLGPIGFTDFSGVDPRFADSGNVGVLDLVAALRWVHDNIEAFGGDPANVTIMGQSGGGAKVCTVMAMSEAGSLVSKGVGLSGNATDAIAQSYSQEIGRRIYEKAGGDIRALQKMPALEYVEFANGIAEEYNEEKGLPIRLGGSFGPVADGFHLPTGKFFSDPSAPSSKMPLLLCSTDSEASLSMANASLEDMGREEAIELIAARTGSSDAEAIYEAFLKVLPGQKPIDAANMVFGYRTGVIATADAKSAQGAPVYVAMFGWDSPLFDGRMRAPHCSDICFWFLNTDLMLTHTGGGKAPRALSRKMADALLGFMRTSDPNVEGLPHWDRYDSSTRPTMFLDTECRQYGNFDTEALKTLQ